MKELLDPDEALARVLAAVPVPRSERLPVEDCLGLALAEDVQAAADLPPFDRAMMDGYAVRLADAGRTVPVHDEIAAGDGAVRAPLTDGHAHPIMTGAPVPAGAQAVVPSEQTAPDGDGVRLPERVKAGANIVVRGAECRTGQVWAARGGIVTPMTIAAALGVGASTLPVHPRPRARVLTTGAELVADAPGAGQIRDSNGPMLVALLREAGIDARRGTVGDDAAALRACIEAAGDGDAVVLTGGVSAGTHDEVPGVLRNLGAEILLHHVAQRPGKPLLVARRGRQLLFGLPGNPLAAHLCAVRYVLPALRRLAGLPHQAVTGTGRLRAALPANKERTWFLPARVDAAGGVTPLLPVSSADLVQPHQANAYLRLEPGAAAMAEGAEVPFTRCGGHAWTL